MFGKKDSIIIGIVGLLTICLASIVIHNNYQLYTLKYTQKTGRIIFGITLTFGIILALTGVMNYYKNEIGYELQQSALAPDPYSYSRPTYSTYRPYTQAEGF